MVNDKKETEKDYRTLGFKVSQELHEKVKSKIESSGLTAKDWIEKAVALTETNSIKEGSIEHKQDLNELEVHTTRIYELVSNMIQRSVVLKESAVRELTERVAQKDTIISEYQLKTKEAIEESKLANESAKELEKEKEELTKQVKQLQATNENNQALIGEYKEKIDTLSGLVTKYQAFAEENQKLKEDHSKESERLQSQVKEITLQTQDQQDEIKELKQMIENLRNNHVVELEHTTEKKDFEKDRALLELEREYQNKLAVAHEDHNEKIKQLYDELAAIRKDYEAKIEGLKEENKKDVNNKKK